MIRRSSKLPSYPTQAEVRALFAAISIYGIERSSASRTPMGFESEKSSGASVDPVDHDLRADQRRTQEPQDAPSRAVSRISNPVVATFLVYLLLLGGLVMLPLA
jgi:hypothetical protein